MIYSDILQGLSASEKVTNKKFVQKLKKNIPDDLDERSEAFHEETFLKIDCLQCANCCKTTSPIFYSRDIERIGEFLKMRPAEVVEKYLMIDEDKDYVLKSSPCTFLGPDNYCAIYEARPNACREYPHTKRKRFHQVLDLALKNTLVCPAVVEIMRKLRKAYP